MDYKAKLFTIAEPIRLQLNFEPRAFSDSPPGHFLTRAAPLQNGQWILQLDLRPGGGGGGGGGGGVGGGGDSHMKGTGMLVVSLRGVNFGFWSRLGCSGQNVIIFSRRGLI